MVAALPPVVMVKAKVASEGGLDREALAARLEALGPGRLDDRDGLKWIGARSWIHVRPSNTEPVVRLIAEAETEADAHRLVEQVRDAF
jgi:phosphomannomutase